MIGTLVVNALIYSDKISFYEIILQKHELICSIHHRIIQTLATGMFKVKHDLYSEINRSIFIQGTNCCYNLSYKAPLCEKCPNTELFLVRIQSKCRKIQTRNNSLFGHFPRSEDVRTPLVKKVHNTEQRIIHILDQRYEVLFLKKLRKTQF